MKSTIAQKASLLAVGLGTGSSSASSGGGVRSSRVIRS